MRRTNFVSPTMNWLYEKSPDWPSNKEERYKHGFSGTGTYDVYGYDINGFNEEGYDRLGCTVEHYKNPEVLEIARLSKDRMSLSHKLHLGLPRFLRMKPTFEAECRKVWDIEPGWNYGSTGLPKDGKKRFIMDVYSEVCMGVSWFNSETNDYNYFSVMTDVRAILGAANPATDFAFRTVSKLFGGYEDVYEEIKSVANVEQFGEYISSTFLADLQGNYLWSIHVVDSPSGPFLTPRLKTDQPFLDGDLLFSDISAKTEKEAIQHVLNKSRTRTLSDMADRGIRELEPSIGHSAPGCPKS